MLNIQKHILLISDTHFAEFTEYLKTNKADLPCRLLTAIRHHGWNQPDSDMLCELVYGDNEEKTRKKFLQLTHHTFKLSAYLSKNHPSYLKHNLQQVEELINRGESQKANTIVNYLVDVCEKTEDYSTLADAYKFLAQQAYITESREASKYHQRVSEALMLDRDKNELYFYIRENLFFKKKENIAKSQLEKDRSFFDAYVHSNSLSVSILARFGQLYELFFLNHPDFNKPETLIQLESLEKELLNSAYITFHALDDIHFKILGLKLQYQVNRTNTDAMLKESQRMLETVSSTRFWSSYVNVPELFAIAVQTSHYISQYGFTFKDNHLSEVPKDVQESIEYLKLKVQEEISKDIWEEGHIIKLINVRSIYAALLLMGPLADRQKAIKVLEDTLITYQQIPFQKFLDQMFAGLIIGYFSLKQYGKVAECYKRYKKITADHLTIEENELTISAYYYASQYITSQRRQYIDKLESTLEEARDLPHVQLLVVELARYFNIPVQLPQKPAQLT